MLRHGMTEFSRRCTQTQSVASRKLANCRGESQNDWASTRLSRLGQFCGVGPFSLVNSCFLKRRAMFEIDDFAILSVARLPISLPWQRDFRFPVLDFELCGK